MDIVRENENGLRPGQIKEALAESLRGKNPKKVLIIPPDITRANSGGGDITSMYFELFEASGVYADILPAIGTHTPMTRGEQIAFFGPQIPEGRFLVHDWRNKVTKIGEVPASFVREASEGIMDMPIEFEISNYLLDPSYDLILSVGQVVPHEVAGMANYTKNIAVGCGGSGFIGKSHMLGAFYGLERVMGRDHTPVRKVFDYVQSNFLAGLPLEYVLTVTASKSGKTEILGLYIGSSREGFAKAVKLSQRHNISYVKRPIENCVVWLDGREFHSTWIGNKAVYRTRMAMAEGGQLVVLAPGVKMFGEDPQNDRLIRKYGYIGRENVLRLRETEADLQENPSVAAHLIHGSADGKFEVTYAAPNLTRQEIEGAGFGFMPFDEAAKKYDPKNLKQGYNILPTGKGDEGTEEIYFIENPALGLWALEGAFD